MRSGSKIRPFIRTEDVRPQLKIADASAGDDDCEPENPFFRVPAPHGEAVTVNIVPPLQTPIKHIRPCTCDLTEEARRRIDAHHRKLLEAQGKYLARVKEIEDELRRIEEERLAAEQEAIEEQELYGDKYEMIGKKRKRKKRSARRASMVSIGVKQRIKWKDPPKIKVTYNQAHTLRSSNSAYCGRKKYHLPLVREINYEKYPIIPVRITRTYEVRTSTNWERKDKLKTLDDFRPRFFTAVLSL